MLSGVVFLLALAIAPLLAQAPRDAQTPLIGGAAVSGKVLTIDGQPIARAQVSLRENPETFGRSMLTDDQGVFIFEKLPAGRYVLTATKPGFLPGEFGQRKPQRPGTPLVVADGADVRRLEIHLTRGGVIAGIVRDHAGQPALGATVRVLRPRYLPLYQSILEVGSNQVDDRGQYRIHDLPPGEYLVLVEPAWNAVGANTVELDGVQTQRRDTFPPVFFPGVLSASQATPVSVRAGEERGGIDIQLRLLPTVSVRGQIVGPNGPAAGARATLTRMDDDTLVLGGNTAVADSQGRFVFTAVIASRYRLVAVSNAEAAFGTATANDAWGISDVDVNDRDVSGLSVALTRGVTVAGRVVFVGGMRPSHASDGSSFHLFLTPPARLLVGVQARTISLDATGGFAIVGVLMGRYVVSAPPEWHMKSVSVDGKEALDGIVDIAEDTTDLTVTFTDVPAQLSGKLLDANQKPVPGYTVILFPADPARWTPNLHTSATVADASGAFMFDSLIPGGYLLAAVDDPNPDVWFDPAFLATLRLQAVPVTIVEGQKAVQDLKIKREFSP